MKHVRKHERKEQRKDPNELMVYAVRKSWVKVRNPIGWRHHPNRCMQEHLMVLYKKRQERKEKNKGNRKDEKKLRKLKKKVKKIILKEMSHIVIVNDACLCCEILENDYDYYDVNINVRLSLLLWLLRNYFLSSV